MMYVSTKKNAHTYSLGQALDLGISEDGGLFVPENIPALDLTQFRDEDSFQEFSSKLLLPFFQQDPLRPELISIVNDSLNFSIPLHGLSKKHFLLELFHGPTGAFKDVGARFLAECFSRLKGQKTILVATSGDTGGAVASAFFRKKGSRVVVLFPQNGVSPLQKKQLTCWGENVLSLEVEGDFDCCQKMVKEAFANARLKSKYHLTSANSINIGRLLPQMTYYAYWSLKLFRQHGQKINIVIPSGNMGNAMGAIWAMQMGLPIKRIHLATNENRAIYEFIKQGRYSPRASVKTLANAMDVGHPSNMERLLFHLEQYPATAEKLTASWHGDDDIKKTIRKYFSDSKSPMVVCPHTAVALSARELFAPEELVLFASTAHPYKFSDVLAPLIGREVEIPEACLENYARPLRYRKISGGLKDLEKELELQSAE